MKTPRSSLVVASMVVIGLAVTLVYGLGPSKNQPGSTGPSEPITHIDSNQSSELQSEDCLDSACVAEPVDLPTPRSSNPKIRTTQASVYSSALPSSRYSRQIFDSLIESKDVFYRSAQTDANTTTQLYMNIYRPAGDSLANRPTLIFLHEGGWCYGDRSNEDEAAKYYAKMGYTTATIDYRLSVNFNCQFINGEIPYDNDAMMQSINNSGEDLIAAIAFLKNHALDYGVDVNKIADLGWSAGGMSVLRTLAPDYTSQDKANVSFAMGGTINDLMENAFGPFANTPPLLLINPEFDEQWAGEQPDIHADCQRLNSTGGDCTSIELPTTHADLNFIRFSEYILPFLKNKLGL